jgi:peroxiredoxin
MRKENTMNQIKVGDMAPDFALKDQNGTEVKLSDCHGKRVLLSWHPLAWTGVCKVQMETLELKKPEFDKMNVIAFGLSIDHQYTKKAWAEAIGIKDTRLLSDFWPIGEVAKKYGQFIDKLGFSGRANFIVDEKGKITWIKVYEIVHVPDIEEVMTVLKK